MDWSKATTDEHELVLSYIKRIRRINIIGGIVFLLVMALLLALGIWMIVDGTMLGITPIILGVFLGLVGFGMMISDLDKSKKIKAQEYWVSRCRVVNREVLRAMRHTDHYVYVLCPNGNTSKYKVQSFVYRNAKEDGAKALLVDYSEEHKGHRELSIDCVV